jgi:hypothetical protein
MALIHYRPSASSGRIVLFSVALSILFFAEVCLANDTGSALANSSTLSGVIKDALGRPVAGVEVLVQAGGRTVARMHTDSAGTFQFKTIAPGTYTISVNKQGFKPTLKIVVVSPGKRHEPMPLAMEATAPLTLKVITERLNEARNDLAPEIGATAYRFDQQSIHRLPEGQNTDLAQVLQQAPGVSQDSYGQGQEQIHVHGENGGGIQYRINNIFLPEAVTSFGEIFSPRFVHSITLLTGVLPAEIGYRTEGIIDIRTKDGCTDGGPDNDNFEMYGGQRETVQPSFEIGGCKGRFSYYLSGYYEHTSLGLQAPTDSPDPNHDYSDQGQGFGYLSYLFNSDTRLSLMTGVAVNSFEIPPEPGLPSSLCSRACRIIRRRRSRKTSSSRTTTASCRCRARSARISTTRWRHSAGTTS